MTKQNDNSKKLTSEEIKAAYKAVKVGKAHGKPSRSVSQIRSAVRAVMKTDGMI